MRSLVPRQRQRGIALFVVFVMVLLTTLLVLGASRIALINEMATGITDAEYDATLDVLERMARNLGWAG